MVPPQWGLEWKDLRGSSPSFFFTCVKISSTLVNVTYVKISMAGVKIRPTAGLFKLCAFHLCLAFSMLVIFRSMIFSCAFMRIMSLIFGWKVPFAGVMLCDFQMPGPSLTTLQNPFTIAPINTSQHISPAASITGLSLITPPYLPYSRRNSSHLRFI